MALRTLEPEPPGSILFPVTLFHHPINLSPVSGLDEIHDFFSLTRREAISDKRGTHIDTLIRQPS